MPKKLDPRILENFSECDGGFQCHICESISKNRNTMRDHVQCHLDPEFKKKQSERKKVNDKNRGSNPERRRNLNVYQQKSMEKLKKDPKRLENKRSNVTNYLKTVKSTTEGKERLKLHNTRHQVKTNPGSAFKHLMLSKEREIAPDVDTQELVSTTESVGTDLAEESWEILQRTMSPKPYFAYTFLFVDPIARDMGLVEYLKSVRHNPEITLETYYGKNAGRANPSSYHKSLHHSSTPRSFCAKQNKIAYVINTECFDKGSRMENKAAVETAEFFWQTVGFMQKSKILHDRVQWSSINEQYELMPVKEKNLVTKKLVEDAAFVAKACDGFLCLDFLAGECNKVHNKDKRYCHYGKMHLDLAGIQPYDFGIEPSDDKPGPSRTTLPDSKSESEELEESEDSESD